MKIIEIYFFSFSLGINRIKIVLCNGENWNCRIFHKHFLARMKTKRFWLFVCLFSFIWNFKIIIEFSTIHRRNESTRWCSKFESLNRYHFFDLFLATHPSLNEDRSSVQTNVVESFSSLDDETFSFVSNAFHHVLFWYLFVRYYTKNVSSDCFINLGREGFSHW